MMFVYRTVYVLPVLGPNCECVDGTSTKLRMRCLCGDRTANAYTKRDIENPNEYKYNKGTKNDLDKYYKVNQPVHTIHISWNLTIVLDKDSPELFMIPLYISYVSYNNTRKKEGTTFVVTVIACGWCSN